MKEYHTKEDGIVFDHGSGEFYYRYETGGPDGIWCRIDHKALVGRLVRDGRKVDEALAVLSWVEDNCSVRQVKEQCLEKQGFTDGGQTLVLLPAIYRN